MLVVWCQLSLRITIVSCFVAVLGNAASVTDSTESTDSVVTMIPKNSVISTALTVLPANTLEPSQLEQCLNDSVTTLTPVDSSFGSIDTFYDIAQMMCQNMQAELDDEYLKTLASITIGQNADVKSYAGYFLKKQFWAVLFLIIYAAFIVILPYTGVCFFCGRCCCNTCGAKRKHAHPSKAFLCTYLLLLFGVLIVIITSSILYLESINYAIGNIDDVDRSVQKISQDLTNVINAASGDVVCKVNITLSQLFGKTKDLVWRLPTTVYDAFKNSYGFVVMQSIIDDMGNVSYAFGRTVKSVEKTANDINQIPSVIITRFPELKALSKNLNATVKSIRKVQEQYDNVYEQVNKTWNTVDSLIYNSNNEVNQTLAQASKIIDKAHQQTMGVIATISGSIEDFSNIIRNATEKVHVIHNEYVNFPERKAVEIILHLMILIPALLVAIPGIIVVVCGAMRLFASDRFPSKRPRLCNYGGYLGLFAIAAAFFTGWIVMLIASLNFVGGYSIETICRPLFYDPQMRFFKAVPMLQFDITSPIDGQNLSINVGNIMEQCKSNDTILSVLKLKSLINIDAIMKKADIDGARDNAVKTFKATNMSYFFPDEQLKELNKSFKALNQENENLQNFFIPDEVAKTNKEFSEDLNYTKSNISDLIALVTITISNVDQVIRSSFRSGNFTDEGVQILGELFNKTIDDVKKNIGNAKDYLLKESFVCRPVYDIWQNVGTLLCQKVARPLNGLWAAASLMAICFIPAIVLTTLIVKYLFKMSRKYDLKKNLSGSAITMSTTTDAYQ